MKVAVIDIGSNSVRLMLWADGTTLYKKINTTRLGEGIALSGRLSSAAIERSAQAVAAFCDEATREGAEATFAFATAAVRSAENGRAFCARVKELCGLDVDVVSGETEAKLGVSGALMGEEGGIVDIGGACTEVSSTKCGFAVSLNIGAVRLYDMCGDCEDKLFPVIEEKIAEINAPTDLGKMYAIGGTATTLASVKLALKTYDPNRIQGCVITRSEAKSLAKLLLSKTCEERKVIAGMDVRRADVIAGAALLFYMLMEKLDLREITVSERDNLEGYLNEKMRRGL
ncbi:MAG: hypothetical protein K2L87_01175 [Clostridiales bacterium]|nr:hypothetical protein [Clostridiales bacterium]